MNKPGKKLFRIDLDHAQVVLEYLLLLGAVVVVVLLAFRTLIPMNRNSAEGYFNETVKGIWGPPVVYQEKGKSYDRLRQHPAASYP